MVAFLGLSDRAESEGFDRSSLALPADQLAVLARLKDAGVPVVVVLSNGAVVEISSWRDGVGAIVEGWLLGQEGGRALADVLLGAVNPSGRLTETIPHRLEDTPSHLTFPGTDWQALYGEDVFVGYRAYDTQGTDVAYPFGHGLSYTEFAYDDLRVTALGDNTWRATLSVTNRGERAGAEVVQLYVGAVDAQTVRPAHELRAFEKVFLEPGEQAEVSLEITPRDLAHWSARHGRWAIDAGRYRVEVGASSRDIRLVAEIESSGDAVVDPLHADSTVAEWAANPVGAQFIEGLRAALPADRGRRRARRPAAVRPRRAGAVRRGRCEPALRPPAPRSGGPRPHRGAFRRPLRPGRRVGGLIASRQFSASAPKCIRDAVRGCVASVWIGWRRAAQRP